MTLGQSQIPVAVAAENTTPIAVCKQDPNMFAPNAAMNTISGQSLIPAAAVAENMKFYNNIRR